MHLGFASAYSTPTDYSFERAPRYRVELHTTMDGITKQQKRQMMTLVDRAEPCGGARSALSDSDRYLYALMHLYKHFVTAGAGVRLFLDIYVIGRTALLDLSYVDAMLDALGIRLFAETVCALNRVLFEGEALSERTATLIAYVFDSYAFGTQEAYIALAKTNAAPAEGGRIRRFVTEHGFDRYSMTKRYPVLEKAAICYPVCAAHRVVRGMLFKRSVLKDAVVRDRDIKRQYRQSLETVMRMAGVM